MKTQETFVKKSGHTPVLCVRKYFLVSAFWKLTNMVMKKAGHCSIPSNQTGECAAIFLPEICRPISVNFLSEYSFILNASHGTLFQDTLKFPPKPFTPTSSLVKSLPCLQFQPGLKPFLVTSKQK